MIKPWWVSLQFATSLFAKLSEHVLDMRRLWHHETEPAEGTGLIVVIGEPGTIRRRWARMGIREEQRKDMASCSTKSRGDCHWVLDLLCALGRLTHSSGMNNEVERDAAARPLSSFSYWFLKAWSIEQQNQSGEGSRFWTGHHWAI